MAKNAVTWKRTTTIEFIIPTKEHTMAAAGKAAHIGNPNHEMNVTLKAAPNVAREAKDKSNTPAANPTVAPIAITVVIDMDFNIVTKLLKEKNACGAQTEKKRKAIIIAISTPHCDNIFPKDSLFLVIFFCTSCGIK